MRFNMDIDLKRSVDTNYGTQWDRFTVEEALYAVTTVVLRTSNVAVYRKEFASMTQREGETIQEFVNRLKTCASDCSLLCPFELTHDLTDYHLINRLRSEIHEPRPQELLQKQDVLNIVPSIVTYGEAYESAVTDKEKLDLHLHTSQRNSI